MAISAKMLCALFFFICLIHRGKSITCTGQSDLKLNGQTKTGKVEAGKPEWNVTITNPCDCTFTNTILSCAGFQTVEKIDPSILFQSGDDCLLNGGNAIAPRSTFSFTYAWDTSFPFAIKVAQIACG